MSKSLHFQKLLSASPGKIYVTRKPLSWRLTVRLPGSPSEQVWTGLVEWGWIQNFLEGGQRGPCPKFYYVDPPLGVFPSVHVWTFLRGGDLSHGDPPTPNPQWIDRLTDMNKSILFLKSVPKCTLLNIS